LIVGSSEEDEEDEEMMERAGRMLSDKVSSLPAGNINIKQLPDGNKHKTSPGVIQVVEFHPSSDVLMTAGLYKTLSLYQIDNESNPLIQSIHLERFPIHHCHFSTCGKEVIVTGNKRWYYLFDMYTGRVIRINEIKGHRKTNISNFKISPDNTIIAFTGDNGYIHLISNKSKQWIADLKMNGNVIDVEFTPDGSHLLSTGSDGHVYIWSMSSRNCVHRFTDEGATRGTSIAISSNGAHIACGSDSGVVNLYNKDCYHESSPRPYKTIMNLTTSVDHLTFNHSSEILALSSKAKRASLKLYHIQSQSIFSNWPLSNMTCLKTIYGHSFSHDSRALSLGNDNGRALMFRLNHYNNGGTKLD
jgi:U3 small nucleolar RNA-associated protein 18